MQYLTTYNPIAQHCGEWLRGYDWSIYGCGTFRRSLSRKQAIALSKRFFEKLSRRHHIPVAYIGVVEHRGSGLGLPAIREHLHFLAASSCDRAHLKLIAEGFWEGRYGNAKIDEYNPLQGGAFYVAKLAAHNNGELIFDNLDRLTYRGTTDLIQAANSNRYVPDRLKGRTCGEFLAMRDPTETFADAPEWVLHASNELEEAA